MGFPSSIDALLVIALLIPGFITLTLFRWITCLEKQLAEYHMILWSLVSSLIIFGIFSYSVEINDFSNLQQIILTPENLVLLLGLSVILGGGLGIVIKLLFRKDFVRGDCWEVSMKEAGQKGTWVTIHTNDDCEYIGYLHYSGGGDKPKDLTIREPELILRDKNWDITKKIEMGKEILFLEKDIKRIVFYKEI